jgi:hypothetical protein
MTSDGPDVALDFREVLRLNLKLALKLARTLLKREDARLKLIGAGNLARDKRSPSGEQHPASDCHAAPGEDRRKVDLHAAS